ncbi:AraC family transcriptional regulator [Pseudomonas sp. MM211]|uniref:helix-turn-helix domain-containing protein n=1 Tax=Pseudomonas sp. MM211 TaxID=2866808 RepID=UPI001CEDE564|nr:AraC family transcriptional regulator [Pseudomonas sp. MM211]UCJ18594.1 AraC family transcriptional regulator [Pseudomonas sp. MM211]
MNRVAQPRPTLVARVAAPVIGRLTAWQEDVAKQLMLDHLDAGISVAEVAEACALSRSHFTRKFKESTCLSPHVWLRQQRVEKAREMLLQSSLSLSLTAIAMDCGFFDQAHFCRVFAKSMGMSPLAWKRQQMAAQPAVAMLQQLAC